MSFYIGKLYISFKPKDAACHHPIEVWEEVVIFDAVSPEEALHKARDWGSNDTDYELEGFSLLPDGSAMMQRFEGTRELTNLPLTQSPRLVNNRILSGMPMTFSFFEVADGNEIESLLHSTIDRPVKYIGTSSRPIVQFSFDEADLNKTLFLLPELVIDSSPTPQRDWKCLHFLYELVGESTETKTGILLLELLVLVGVETGKSLNRYAEELGTIYGSRISFAGDFACNELRYRGVRKTVSVDNAEIGIDFFDLEPTDKTQVTYTKFFVENDSDLKDLLNDDDVYVQFNLD